MKPDGWANVQPSSSTTRRVNSRIVAEEPPQPASVFLWLTTQNKIGVDRDHGTIR